jgi:hypothetical protein
MYVCTLKPRKKSLATPANDGFTTKNRFLSKQHTTQQQKKQQAIDGFNGHAVQAPKTKTGKTGDRQLQSACRQGT